MRRVSVYAAFLVLDVLIVTGCFYLALCSIVWGTEFHPFDNSPPWPVWFSALHGLALIVGAAIIVGSVIGGTVAALSMERYLRGGKA